MGYALDATDGRVGIVRVPGVGAPVTALLMEELIARGAERFLALGHVGSLQPDVELGDLVVVDRALRDEGTSHHYLDAGAYVDATPALCDRLEAALNADRSRLSRRDRPGAIGSKPHSMGPKKLTTPARRGLRTRSIGRRSRRSSATVRTGS